MIKFISLNNISIKINKKTIVKWMKTIVELEKRILGDIVIVLGDDKFLIDKNIQYLKHETLTDVITFDYSEKDMISGDILISVQRVLENSKLYKTTFLNELCRVMAHGLLHLLGYNDKTAEEKKTMKSKENYYLEILEKNSNE